MYQFFCLFTLLSLLSMSAFAETSIDYPSKEKISQVSQQLHLKLSQTKNTKDLKINLYKTNFILPFAYNIRPPNDVYGSNTPKKQPIKNEEFIAQISVYAPLWRHPISFIKGDINVAYTQRMFWQLYTKSEYFRELNYEPEIFLVHRFNPFTWVNLGLSHESNGRGNEFQRSWNRAYLDLNLRGKYWRFSVKPWFLIFKKQSTDRHNKDIAKYLGHARILAALKVDNMVLGLMARNSFVKKGKYGAIELSTSYHLKRNFSIFARWFYGYGHSLVEYNHLANTIGVGLSLNNLL